MPVKKTVRHGSSDLLKLGKTDRWAAQEELSDLEDDAGTAALVAKTLLLGALDAQEFDVEGADAVRFGQLVETAAGEVLAAARHRVVS